MSMAVCLYSENLNYLTSHKSKRYLLVYTIHTVRVLFLMQFQNAQVKMPASTERESSDTDSSPSEAAAAILRTVSAAISD